MHDPRVLPLLLGEWFTRLDDLNRDYPSSVYLTLAVAMDYAFKNSNLVHTLERSGKPVTSAEGGSRGPSALPVLFSTNYDREMERAFDLLYARRCERGAEERPCGYHVAVPVWSGCQGETNLGAPSWLIRKVTFRPGAKDGGRREYWQLLPQDGPPRTEYHFTGPLLVKLHGSPTDSLSFGEDWGAGSSAVYTHRVVISESDYLRDILLLTSPTASHGNVGSERLPPWLSDLFFKAKTLCFLGQSVSDWNIRLRLFDQSGLQGGAERKRYAVNRAFTPEPHVTHLFSTNAFAIESVRMDLREFCSRLLRGTTNLDSHLKFLTKEFGNDLF
jgi:hypothetical protein